MTEQCNKRCKRTVHHYLNRVREQAMERVRIWAYLQRCNNKKPPPKLARQVFARTRLHEAWLQGWSGSFLLPVLERQ